MLKTYMPRAIAVHMFVSQYIWLQFDRERDESYKEKRTRILKWSKDCKSVSSLLSFDQVFQSALRIVPLCRV
uniref:Uncharacterized protein n=1 Tax=Aegilops tauschii subsp. strangulata TaxID=200361 RepID=A0A453KW20_AEGTS